MERFADVSPLTIAVAGVVALVVVLAVMALVRRRREARAAAELNPGPPDWDAVPRAFPAGGLEELASSDEPEAEPSDHQAISYRAASIALAADETPLFWWWMQSDAAGRPAARVVILTKDLLLLSGPLGRDQVAELHAAQEGGDLLDADLGEEPALALLPTVVGMDHDVGLGRLRVESQVGSDRRVVVVAPPGDSAGIALAVYQVLVERLGERRCVDVAVGGPQGDATATPGGAGRSL